jgi:hypothetical protein
LTRPAAAAAAAAAARVFVLSPADCSGKRARLLQNPEADHYLARRLRRTEGAELGEVFSFVSSLYFRGKLAYARRFARAPAEGGGVYVITPGDGLLPPETAIRDADLRRFARVPIDRGEDRYRRPLLRDLRALEERLRKAEVVLLGSIASDKYAELLLSVLGDRLLFPVDFVGRGDMSRGGLMLRAAKDGRELPYKSVVGAERHGSRPPRLPPLRRGLER